MSCLVISDIFGRTQALESLSRELEMSFEILDPYSGRYMGFASQEEAYDGFLAVGLDAYAEMVKKRLAAYVYPVLVIAFSVGASSLWAVSDKLNPETPARAICFYGSQIRHNLNIIPNFPFDLILPEKEAGFCVDELGKALYAKPNTRVFRTGYLHGFMNKESKNYSASGYREYMDKLKLLNW